jgi:hypothetical protein
MCLRFKWETNLGFNHPIERIQETQWGLMDRTRQLALHVMPRLASPDMCFLSGTCTKMYAHCAEARRNDIVLHVLLIGRFVSYTRVENGTALKKLELKREHFGTHSVSVTSKGGQQQIEDRTHGGFDELRWVYPTNMYRRPPPQGGLPRQRAQFRKESGWQGCSGQGTLIPRKPARPGGQEHCRAALLASNVAVT